METSISFGKWSQSNVPHKGWECIDIEDLGEPSATCEMCEKQTIRYVHYMQHPDYQNIFKTGCICAGKMEENYAKARSRDDFMKSRSQKRKRWLDRKWLTSNKGNTYIKSDGFIIVMKCSGRVWNALIKNEDGNIKEWSKRKYESINSAKLAAFDCLTKILAEKHISNNTVNSCVVDDS